MIYVRHFGRKALMFQSHTVRKSWYLGQKYRVCLAAKLLVDRNHGIHLRLNPVKCRSITWALQIVNELLQL